MARRLTWLTLGLLVASAGIWFAAPEPAHIVDLKLDHYERYDRLVVELSKPTEIVQRPENQWRDLIVDLAADAPSSFGELRTRSPRVGVLVLERTAAGARLSSTRRERRLRLFQLASPPRLVVDFTDRFDMVMSAPGGALGVPLVPLTDPEVAFSAASGHGVSGLDRLLEVGPTAAGGAPTVGLDAPAAGGSSAERIPGVGQAEGPLSEWLAVAPTRTSKIGGYSRLARWMAGLPVALAAVMLVIAAVRRLLVALGWLRSLDAVALESAPLKARPRGDRSASAGEIDGAWSGPHEVLARMQLEERIDALQAEVRALRDGLDRLERRTGHRTEPAGFSS